MSLIETFKLKRHAINHLAGLTMTEQFCTAKLHEFEQFVLQKREILCWCSAFYTWRKQIKVSTESFFFFFQCLLSFLSSFNRIAKFLKHNK